MIRHFEKQNLREAISLLKTAYDASEEIPQESTGIRDDLHAAIRKAEAALEKLNEKLR